MRDRTAKVTTTLIMLTLLLSCAYAQTYTTFAESSGLGGKTIPRTSALLVLSDLNNFMWNRTIETSVREQFDKKGIKTILTSDYIDLCEIAEEGYQKVLDLYLDTKADFMLVVTIENLNTYASTDGIKNFTTKVSLLNYLTSEMPFKAEMYTESDRNDLLPLNSTRKPAIESMAEALVQEYLKYVK